MKKALRSLLVISISIFILSAVWIVCSRHLARIDLGDDGIRLRDIGFYPTSGEMYAEGVGFVDSTLFYQARVTPDEVEWLERVPVASFIEAPASAPSWWRLGFWWHGLSPDIRYFRTAGKWPCVYAYSRKDGVIFGTVEYE